MASKYLYSTLLTCNNNQNSNYNSLIPNKNVNLLTQQNINPFLITIRTLKYKLRLHKRCRSCYLYFNKDDGHYYIGCHKHPRHKQIGIKRHTLDWKNYLSYPPSGYISPYKTGVYQSYKFMAPSLIERYYDKNMEINKWQEQFGDVPVKH
ncbi:unnamed protein product [Gordionus sp. m RMFG-2023]